MSEPPQPRKQTPGHLIIAIDGPAGAGKSTIARLLAERLSLPYLDTGAMYRAAALLALRAGIEPPFSPGAGVAISDLLARHQLEVSSDQGQVRVLLDGEDVSSEIRSPECSRQASAVSTLPEVRRTLVRLQRQMGARAGGVLEGRDIGTVVFPDADLKVFLTARPDERAHRRFKELCERGVKTTLEQVRDEQHQRDQQDATRADSPLRPAERSVVVDTSGVDTSQVVARILAELASSSHPTLDSTGENTVRSRNHGS